MSETADLFETDAPVPPEMLSVTNDLGEEVATWACEGGVMIEIAEGSHSLDAHLTVEQARELMRNLQLQIGESRT